MACGKMMNLEEKRRMNTLPVLVTIEEDGSVTYNDPYLNQKKLSEITDSLFDLRNRIKCLEMIQERREIDECLSQRKRE